VGHADIGLAALPTVQSDTFEIALDRSAQPDGSPLFSGDSLRIALSSRGDRLPDADGGLGYVLSDTDAAANAPSLDRPGSSDLRLLSYNVPNNFDRNENTLFETDHQPSYRRMLRAAAPDVIGFQEMYDNTAAEVEQVVETDIDGVPDSWSWAKAGGELVLGSRHSIEATHPIPGADGQPSAAFLLDTQDALGDSLLVVLMHPKCCSGASEDRSRQATVDGVVAFLRDVQNGEGPFGVGASTPIVVAGDMNFVGDPQQPRTLRTGQIQNTDRFGPPAAPDWDGTPLLDTNPRHTGAPLHTTTFEAGGAGSYPPGRLDYVYLTDSVLEAVHAFTLNTEALSDAALDTYGLQRNDTTIGSDHLPLVVDLTLR
jgi:endonuclease/exonuclease/phosphatase family metal-dependent hydrolase